MAFIFLTIFFACSDLFRMGVDETGTMSGRNGFVIILSTLSKSKAVFLFNLMQYYRYSY